MLSRALCEGGERGRRGLPADSGCVWNANQCPGQPPARRSRSPPSGGASRGLPRRPQFRRRRPPPSRDCRGEAARRQARWNSQRFVLSDRNLNGPYSTIGSYSWAEILSLQTRRQVSQRFVLDDGNRNGSRSCGRGGRPCCGGLCRGRIRAVSSERRPPSCSSLRRNREGVPAPPLRRRRPARDSRRAVIPAQAAAPVEPPLRPTQLPITARASSGTGFRACLSQVGGRPSSARRRQAHQRPARVDSRLGLRTPSRCSRPGCASDGSSIRVGRGPKSASRWAALRVDATLAAQSGALLYRWNTAGNQQS